MNLKKIAFLIIKNDDKTVVLSFLALFLFLIAILSIFSEKNSEIMIFSMVVAIFLFLAVGGFLLLKFLEFLNLKIELEEEVELLKKHGCNNEQIETILKNRNDFWFLLGHLRAKEEEIEIKKNDERIKNLYKKAGINITNMNLLN